MIFGKVIFFIEFLEKHIAYLSIITLFSVLVLVSYAPLIIGGGLLFLLSIFIIGTFRFSNIRRSLKKIIIFLFLSGIVCLPLLCMAIKYKYRHNHPEFFIKNDNPEIIKMTKEFKEECLDYGSNDKEVLECLEEYVYEEIPYSAEMFSLPSFPRAQKKLYLGKHLIVEEEQWLVTLFLKILGIMLISSILLIMHG
ncbi:hypothetical protein J7K24_00300 [bacterium]|nr:hypothetical protein [bacterium]